LDVLINNPLHLDNITFYNKQVLGNFVHENEVEFEYVDIFCFHGYMIGAGGGAELASRMRVRCAKNHLRELSILTARGASLNLNDLIYKAYVRSVTIYGSET